MNFGMVFKVAILAIMRNKTRSLLTCIGIIVGIAAVISVLAIGKGASTMMVKEISSMGNNLMMVFPDRNRKGAVRSGMGAGETMTAGDAEAVKRELGHLIRSVSPSVNVSAQLVYQRFHKRAIGLERRDDDDMLHDWSPFLLDAVDGMVGETA